MNLEKLKRAFTDNGCNRLLIKVLSANDNSKNQVYLGGSFEILNILPIGNIINEPAGDWNKERFKASINFSWLDNNGKLFHAPQSQLILYPKYPEVRFSGFLARCANAPSELMTKRLPNRLLFLGIAKDRSIIGFVASPDSEITNEYYALKITEKQGIFSVIELIPKQNSRELLINELNRIYKLGWINSKRLDKFGKVIPCDASQCGGYTLEAELGIIPNGYAEPDFQGWEVKQFGVKNFTRLGSSVITLFTPEPTNGYYVTQGVESFIRKYGYKDLKGRENRMNFGGVHKFGEKQARTGLELQLLGYDFETGKIKNTDGKLSLLDSHGNDVASWSFSSLLEHWNKKHANACYVPSIVDKSINLKYRYGNNVLLGSGTDFLLFLDQVVKKHIYYDPGIKLEHIGQKPEIKRRSQFRIKSQFINSLYKTNETIDVSVRQ